MIEIVVIALAVVGWAFSLSGAVGILRMPDVYCRIQCSSKMITMGALPVLIALVVGEGPVSVFGSRALLVAVLLLVINPVASHALARAAYKTCVPMWPGAVADRVGPRARLADRASGSLTTPHRADAGVGGAGGPAAESQRRGHGLVLGRHGAPVLFVVLGAPDVAHSEVVVGAIALAGLYLGAIGKARTVTCEPGLGETEAKDENQR